MIGVTRTMAQRAALAWVAAVFLPGAAAAADCAALERIAEAQATYFDDLKGARDGAVSGFTVTYASAIGPQSAGYEAADCVIVASSTSNQAFRCHRMFEDTASLKAAFDAAAADLGRCMKETNRSSTSNAQMEAGFEFPSYPGRTFRLTTRRRAGGLRMTLEIKRYDR